MIGNILLKILMIFISIIDRKKLKIIKYFQNNIGNQSITVIDIGAIKAKRLIYL